MGYSIMSIENNYYSLVSDRLKQDGFKIVHETIENQNVLIATNQQFRMSWFATQLNFFVIVGIAEHVTASNISSFSQASINYSIKQNTGLPRGLQSGVVSFSALISPSIDSDAKAWVQQLPKKHFAAFEIPVLIDSSKNEILFCTKTPMWGFIYYGFFRDFIRKYFKSN